MAYTMARQLDENKSQIQQWWLLFKIVIFNDYNNIRIFIIEELS